MGIARYINRLKYIDHMISRKATGDLDTFARRNGLSKSMLSEVLNEMKEMGFPIKYDRQRKTYYYEEAGEMIHQLFIKYGEILSKQDCSKITNLEGLCFSPKAVFEQCKDE